MKILLTGLCLQGNKGGPALALSLMSQLQSLRPGLRFVMAVPGGAEWPHEQRWARRYGVEVCEAIKPGDFLPHGLLRPARRRRAVAWLGAARQADVVVDLSGIAYVSPPAGTLAGAIGGRFTFFVGAALAQRPFLAWTQSYGPFDSRVVRWLARRDLGALPEVYCRGEDCRAAVQALLPEQTVLSFPDVATTLPYDAAAGKDYVESRFGLRAGGFVSVSPSAVLYRKSQGVGGNGHVADLLRLCGHLREKNIRVLLVPHTFRSGRHDPLDCDYGVCLELLRHLPAGHDVRLVAEDLSPSELKSVISAAAFHVGGRYHSIVAALSSGVPALSLAWHPKYLDLMRQYGMSESVYQAVHAEQAADDLLAQVDRALMRAPDSREPLRMAQLRIAAEVAENARRFVACLPGAKR